MHNGEEYGAGRGAPKGEAGGGRSARWESLLSKGHTERRGIKICVYKARVILGSSVTNHTTRPPHRRQALLSILHRTYAGLCFHLHSSLCIGIKTKNPNYSACEMLPWWFDNKTQTTTKRKETKVFNPLP